MRDALRFTLGEKGALAWLLGGFLIILRGLLRPGQPAMQAG